MANASVEELSDVDAPAEEQPLLPPKRRKLSGKKLVLFIVAPLVLLIGAGAGAWRFHLLPFAPSTSANREILFYNIPSMLVNLNAPPGEAHYLKLRVSVQFDSQAAKDRMQQVQPRVLDSFETYLRQLRPSDLNGAAGLYRVKEELLLRVNKALQPLRAQDVLLQQMLVQ
jgi:flagellar FliL protein